MKTQSKASTRSNSIRTPKISTISFVIPVYNEELNVKPLYQQISQEINRTGVKKFEMIFVDDGSQDATRLQLLEISRKSRGKVKTIFFKKNFGKGRAMEAGFGCCRYPYIITLDGDLQDNPADIGKLIGKMEEAGCDMVVGWKFQRKDPTTKIIASRIANLVTRNSTGLKIHDMDCNYRLLKKDVIENIPLHGDLYRFIPHLAASRGYKVDEVKVNHRKRIHGKSKFGWKRLITSSLDYFTMIFLIRYLNRPLHFFGRFAILSGGLGGALLAYLLSEKLSGKLIGQRPILALAFFLAIAGIQFLLFGLLGELIITNNPNKRTYLIDGSFKQSEGNK